MCMAASHATDCLLLVLASSPAVSFSCVTPSDPGAEYCRDMPVARVLPPKGTGEQAQLPPAWVWGPMLGRHPANTSSSGLPVDTQHHVPRVGMPVSWPGGLGRTRHVMPPRAKRATRPHLLGMGFLPPRRPTRQLWAPAAPARTWAEAMRSLPPTPRTRAQPRGLATHSRGSALRKQEGHTQRPPPQAASPDTRRPSSHQGATRGTGLLGHRPSRQGPGAQ